MPRKVKRELLSPRELARQAQQFLEELVSPDDAAATGSPDAAPWKARREEKGVWQKRTLRIANNLKDLNVLASIFHNPASEDLKTEAATKIHALAAKRDDDRKKRKDVYFSELLAWLLERWNNREPFPPDNQARNRNTCAFVRALPKDAREFVKLWFHMLNPATGQMDWPAVVEFKQRYGLIRDIDTGLVVPYRLNPLQLRMNAIWQEIIEDPDAEVSAHGINAIILKPRRIGSSTDNLISFACVLMCHPGFNFVDLAHKEDERGEGGILSTHYNMLDLFFDSLPYPPERKQQVQSSWRTGISFPKNGLDASMSFLSAAARDPGTGTGIYLLMCTEGGKWPASVWASAMNSINVAYNKTRAGLRFHESTVTKKEDSSNFQELFEGKNDGYRRIFFPWHEDPRNADKRAKHQSTDQIAQKYWEEHPECHSADPLVNSARAAWAERIIVGDFQRRVDDFTSEYPANPTEAFAANSGCFFDVRRMIKARSHLCREPVWQGHLMVAPDAANRSAPRREDLRPVQANTGPWKIWHYPDDNEECVIGFDSCTGEADKHGDYAVLRVFSRQHERFNAEYRSQVIPRVQVEQILLACAYYRSPKFTIKLIPFRRNFESQITTLAGLDGDDKNYPLLYGYELYRNEKKDDFDGRPELKYGLIESANQWGGKRLAILDKFRDWLYDRIDANEEIGDAELIAECMTFMLVPGTRQADHRRTKKSDRISAATGCIWGHHADQWPRSYEIDRLSPQSARPATRRGELADEIEFLVNGRPTAGGFFGEPRQLKVP